MHGEKTSVAHISKVKYLGYAFYRYKGKCRLGVHPKSVTKMKDKIREITKRSNGWGNEYRAMKLAQFVRGWVNYFAMPCAGWLEFAEKEVKKRIMSKTSKTAKGGYIIAIANQKGGKTTTIDNLGIDSPSCISRVNRECILYRRSQSN